MDTIEKVFLGTIITVLLFLPGIVIVAIVGLHINTGEGSHTGYVTAVQKQGVFYKTGRAYFKTELESSQEDLYCVIDEEVKRQLEEASESRQRVRVTYFSWFSAGIANCGGEGDIIKSVEAI